MINSMLYLLAGFGAWVILAYLARLGWYLYQQAALRLYIASHRYEREVAERLERYI